MFKKILLATDGSAHAKKAMRLARDLAVRDDAQVIVVHAFKSVPSYLEGASRDELAGRHITEGRKIAEEAAQELEKAGLEVVVEVLEGPPADAILRVVGTRQPDLIVMGTRGHGEVTSLLLGSVSHRVLVHTRVPVMVTKAEVSEST